MKAVFEIPQKPIPDVVVRRAIEYLDSSTDYREFVARRQRIEMKIRRTQRKRTNDVDDFLLVFMPIFLIGIAVVAVVYR